MTILTVTTALDTMNALDGLTSLREALASASAYDVVRFAGFLSGQTINLTLGTLDPGAGGAILVQGDVDGDGAGDVTIAAGAGQAVMAVGIGQLAQFDNMRFTNGGFTASAAMDGGAGGGGANGTNGANGAEGALGTGQAGGDGTSGGPGGTGAKGSDGGTGSVAVGAFLNAGTLILDGCTFEMGSLTGGAGGAGGIGGTGGMGGNAGNGGLGASNDFGDGGLGGNGGAAGAGGQGGFGGFGGYGGFAAAVVNLASGELSLGVNAFLGAGYSGGAGGAGGDGGLGLAVVGGAVEDRSGEVGVFDGIEVGDEDISDAEEREVFEKLVAERAGADHENFRVLQTVLVPPRDEPEAVEAVLGLRGEVGGGDGDGVGHGARKT